ncbi:hypothetical protein E3U55_03445 [Filobacillus milosensis]|uniref:Uncharacterized protein n=1 Tax=Filobacillus milosensis TaxID=94137 RepID=A0A4Y8IT48_9BACI|nr:hypothetical protein [Filobacillus milosensis]TFB23881.1 hypothetical protein E3U55_03445 [Filobacillus milosensis]
MESRFLKFLTLTISISLVIGCSKEQANTSNDSYNDIKKVAWEYIEEQEWLEYNNGNWQDAEVKQIEADDTYELLKDGYDGEQVMSVTFKDEEKTQVSTPVILVDPDTKEVIGYLPGE